MTTRFRLRGRLVTRAPLHVGSGGTVHRPGVVVERTEEAADIAAVVTDHRQRPMLPATALKGATRAWAARHLTDDSVIEAVFGGDERGGSAHFADAFALDGDGPPVLPAHWSAERGTGVVARVALDRRRRTASDQRLFHLEFVPPGLAFEVDVLLEGSEPQLEVLVAAFGAFESGELTLGAHGRDGWGRFAWHLDEVALLDEQAILAWLADGAPTMIERAYRPLPAAERQAVEEAAGGLAAAASPRVAAAMLLQVDGPFLVKDNDPERVGPGIERPDAVPRRDQQGHVVLPASSMRGALRSRAERIVRTLGGAFAACGPDAPRPPCEPVMDRHEVERRLCPVCRLFGGAGWRTPLAISDFRMPKPLADDQLFRQHFVAIDRFTGGAAAGRKFDLRAAWSPALHGQVAFDLEALTRAGVGAWGVALIALLWRDLAEGDLTFGSGGARGFGRAAAVVQPAEDAAQHLAGLLGLAPGEVAGAWPPARDSSLGRALHAAIAELETAAKTANEAGRAVA